MPKQQPGGRVAIVTGAAHGLGRAFAERLAQDGADVIVADTKPAEETAEEIRAAGQRALTFTCDVADPKSVAELFAKTQSDFGHCDILVNNAGIYPAISFDELSFEDWRRVMAINLDSMFLMAKAFVPGMKARGWGRIINISSHSVALMVPGIVHYITSKAAIIGFTRALASELGVHGITVNAIAPGVTKTPGTLGSTPPTGDPDTFFDMIAQQQSIKRAGVPADIVGTLSFLASDDSEFMTAQTLVVDGGLARM